MPAIVELTFGFRQLMPVLPIFILGEQAMHYLNGIGPKLGLADIRRWFSVRLL